MDQERFMIIVKGVDRTRDVSSYEMILQKYGLNTKVLLRLILMDSMMYSY